MKLYIHMEKGSSADESAFTMLFGRRYDALGLTYKIGVGISKLFDLHIPNHPLS